MQKLYKPVDGVLHYHEAWVEDGKLFDHWGRVGDKGEHRVSPKPALSRESTLVKKALEPARAAGYVPIELDDHAVLLVEYAVDGFGTEADLEKRHALEDRLNETLGWAGVGHCDGGSIGSGTMEACCYVVDFDIAREVIERDLAGTRFADYARICDEDAGDV